MSEPQMHISKEGDRYLRTLLVQGAHYILGPFGQDSDLRRWGLNSPSTEERMPRNERSLRWRGSWLYCFTSCG
jgi:transposase